MKKTTEADAWLFKGWCPICPQPYEWTKPDGEWLGPNANCETCGSIIIWGNPDPIAGRLGTPRKVP